MAGGQTRRAAGHILLRTAICAAAMPVAAAACTLPGREVGPAGTRDARALLAQPTHLFWLNWANNVAAQEANTQLIQSFTTRFPQITVEDGRTPPDKPYQEKFAAMMAAGTPPDVFQWQPSNVVDFAARRWVLDLQPLMRRDRFDLEDFSPKGVDQYRWRNGLWGLPLGFANQQMYYNVTEFRRAGLPLPPGDFRQTDWTWDRFLEATRRLTAPPTDDSQPGRWGVQLAGRDLRRWGVWVWSNGGEIIDEQRLVCLLDQPPAAEALQFLQDLIYKYKVWPDPAPPGASLASGQIMMQAGATSSSISNLRRAIGTAFEWGVTFHPRGKARQYVAAGGGAGWAIARESKATEAAWAFLQHITSTEAYVLNCQLAGGGTGGGRRSANADPACAPSEPPLNVRVFIDGADYVHIDPRVPGWDDVTAIFDTELKPLWDGSAAARQVVAEVKRQVDQVLKERARALGI